MIDDSRIRIMRNQVNVLRKCIDLMLNGYLLQVQYITKEYWYFKLRHNRNGHIFEIRCDSFGTTVNKDGKTVEIQQNPGDTAEGLFSN